MAKAVQSAQQQLKPVVQRLKQEAALLKEQDKKQEVTAGICLCAVLPHVVLRCAARHCVL